MKIQFRQWVVPSFCVQELPPRPRQDGLKDAPSWALSEVDADVLAQMCDDFRAEVFRKAGKADPGASR